MKIIDTEQIKKNILNYARNAPLILVLKDNAYGFGLLKVAKLAIECGIDKFAIRSINEGISLRKKYADAFILLLGIPPRKYNLLRKYRLCVTITSVSDYLLFSKEKVLMHIKLNIGMNRLGFDHFNPELFNNELVIGAYFHSPTHIETINSKYLEDFRQIVKDKNILCHVGGSIFLSLKSDFTIRIGEAIYRNSLKLYGKIIAIRYLKKGQHLGYDYKFVANENCLIGITSIGYTNGLTRFAKDRYAYVNGRKCPLVGNTCMDYSFIIINKDTKENDIVEFIGEHISILEFAEMNDLSVHETFLLVK